MSRTDQGVNRERYQVIPRTLIFVTQGEKVLLLRGAPSKKLWANRYNGLGGHIESGEGALAAARRELAEEAGLRVSGLALVGTLLVDAGEEIGIAIFIFRGECADAPGTLPAASAEGQAEWITLNRLGEIPLVEDLKVLLPRVLATRGAPFSARSYYDGEERLQVIFEE